MHVLVEVKERRIRTIEDRAGGLPPIVHHFIVDHLPPVEPGVIRLGWNDAEPHVGAIEREEDEPGPRAEVLQVGRGVITYEEADGIRNEVFLDRALIEPYIAALEATRAAHEADQAMKSGAATTAPIAPPVGFTR